MVIKNEVLGSGCRSPPVPSDTRRLSNITGGVIPQGGANWAHSCEYVKHGEFFYYL